MEKDGYLSWQSESHKTAVAVSAAVETIKNKSCWMDQGQSASSSSIMATSSCFPSLNWDQLSTDQTTNFESALSSLVSSPSSSSNPYNNNPNPNSYSYSSSNLPSSDSIVIRELIGRLGSICNSSNTNCGVGAGDNQISRPNNNYNSYPPNTTDTSCYTTPLNSPPNLNLAIMDHQLPPPHTTDPGFAERAARFSSYAAATTNINSPQFGQPPGFQEPGKLSRASSTHSLTAMNLTAKETPLTGTAGIGQSENHHDTMTLMMKTRTWATDSDNNNNSAQQESSVVAASDRMSPAPSGSQLGNIRKRKASKGFSGNSNSSSSSRGGGKEAPPPVKGAEAEDSISKRCKSVAEAIASGADKDAAAKILKVEQGGIDGESAQGQKQGKEKDKNKDRENSAKPPEPPKQDYIHVRARRGQATDSHSLAERVRREKISERMKFLQDLVPGCNKVTGKAVMLDEIINYVQSLQRQVEFLSMKLATVNPRLEFSVDSLFSKDIQQPSRGLMIPSQSSYPLEARTSTGFSYGNQLLEGQGSPLQSLVGSNGLDTQLDAPGLRRSLSMQLPLFDGFTDSAASQLGALWEDDLHSVVQMGFGQNPEASLSSRNFQGRQPGSQMEVEL